MALLSALLWTPALGALLLVLIPGHKTRSIRWVGNLCTGLALLLACMLLNAFDADDSALQFGEFYPLNPKLGSAYALGVDGLSMPMLVLATLLTCVALLSSQAIVDSIKGYCISVLLLGVKWSGYFSSSFR